MAGVIGSTGSWGDATPTGGSLHFTKLRLLQCSGVHDPGPIAASPIAEQDSAEYGRH